jgi:hypothetical protein
MTATVILPMPLRAKQPREALHIQPFGKDECCSFCCRQKTNNDKPQTQNLSTFWTVRKYIIQYSQDHPKDVRSEPTRQAESENAAKY